MNKVLLVIFLLATCCQSAWAEIRNYALTDIEYVVNEYGKTKAEPLLSEDKKPITFNLILAGLGTERITAQSDGSIALPEEVQVYPMQKDNGTGTSQSEWYYTLYNLGAVIIEIKGDDQ